jgi:phosphotransferase system enzyme I (PtsP)
MSPPNFPFAPGGRRLIRQIREIMAQPGGAQERLDTFVRAIAANLLADVCSVYLERANGDMELCATEGLAATAVHKTRLKHGEGVVGQVALMAEPLAVENAPNHPAFSLRPETEEQGIVSFLGVPILRGGRLLGVLTIQNRTPRKYDEEETETLQTAAMVLAEVVVAPELAAGGEVFDQIALRPTGEERLEGGRVADGLAIGRAVKHEPHVPPALLLTDNPDREVARLEAALRRLRKSLEILLDRGSVVEGASREILETYRMIASDKSWLARLQDAARMGLSAEGAVERVRNEQRARLLTARDPYLRERLHDLEDLANRLLRHLAEDRGAGVAVEQTPEDAILFARSIAAAELLERDLKRVRGVVLEEGSPTSHAAIVARALGIPVVGRLEGVLDRVEPGDLVIVDGAAGIVHLRPSPEALEAHRLRIVRSGERAAAFERMRDEPAVTRDGREITLLMNAGLSVDLGQLDRTGAAGIGLFRTEFQFMIAEKLPRRGEQQAFYAAVLDAAGDRPVTFRTLDLGGDKILPYLEMEREENPAMGWRALRLALDRPALLRIQLRALIAAAADRPLRVMFPMVTTAAEFRAARTRFDAELAWMARRGHKPPSQVEVGAMIETPAIAFQLDALLQEADFVSVGANDLMQFFFAADRSSPRLADRYDVLSPAALGFFKHVRDACQRAGKPVSVCGEIAGRPLEAMALIGLGFDRLSMPAAGVGPVKRLVLGLDAGRVEAAMGDMLASGDASVRTPLRWLAEKIQAPL